MTRNTGKRSIRIDLIKGILVLGMVCAHSGQLLFFGKNPLLSAISYSTNAVSFGGFFFCFGYASWKAYLSKDALPWASIVKTALKCYVVYIVSGVLFQILVRHQGVSRDVVYQVSSLRIVPGYSEFLVSFSFVTILACAMSGWIRRLTETPWRFLLFVPLCLLALLLPATVDVDPVIGIFVGGSKWAYFPIVQFFPFFVAGILVARGKFRYRFIPAVPVAAVIGIFTWLNFPDKGYREFPPSLAGLALGAGFFYLYCGAAIALERVAPRFLKTYLVSIGQNTLLYLLANNLVNFCLVGLGFGYKLSPGQAMEAFAFTLLIALLIQLVTTDFARTSRTMAADD